MKRKLFLTFFLCVFVIGIFAQNIKNIILIVPDGCSVSTLAFARWFQFYKDTAHTHLAIDPYLCGFAKNHCSNAIIANSAPAMTVYMSGYYSLPGFIGMYPPKTPNDLVNINPFWAYSPRLTVMEASRIVGNKATGLVFVCEFPHATPAATHAHWYGRNAYAVIQEQMVHNSIQVLIGGGAGLLTPEQEAFLISTGYEVLKDNMNKFRNADTKKLWALFGEQYMDNDLDRDPEKQPSLAEMTKKAIHLLSKNEDGFFLMVEGSKIDWSSHRNDPVGILSEVLAFDAAVKVAIEFAEADGETLVLICPDHGNGGISIGNSRSDLDYDKLSLQAIMETLKKCTKTSEYLTDRITQLPKDSISFVIEKYWGISPDIAEINMIYKVKELYNNCNGNQEIKEILNDLIAKVLQSRTYIGFTTHGHTGEDVFLAIYHPQNKRLTGLVTADEINRYLCDAIGLTVSLDDLTEMYYCKATDLFEKTKFTLTGDNKYLKINPKNNKKQALIVEANSNQVKLNGNYLSTKTPAIYVDKTDTWHVSKEILSMLNY